MKYFRWLLLVLLAFALGVLVVEYMTVHPIRMSAYLLLSTITAFALIVFVVLSFRGKQSLSIALGVVLVALLAGYLLRTETVLARADDRPVPELKRNIRLSFNIELRLPTIAH